MSNTIEILEQQLRQQLGSDIPAHPAGDVHDALEVAQCLEAKGFSFAMKDLYPKSLDETGWRATFMREDMEFTAEDTNSAVAVCTAALGALSHQ